MALTIELTVEEQGTSAILRCIFPVKTTPLSAKCMIDHLGLARFHFLSAWLYCNVNSSAVIIAKYMKGIDSVNNSDAATL